MVSTTRLITVLGTGLVVFALLGCGGGGGGDPLNSTGEFDMTIEKERMDSGDLNRISVNLYDINPRGVILKFHYPRSMTYSKNTALLIPSGERGFEVTPFTEATDGPDRYLVFFLSPAKGLGKDDMAIQFDIKAITQDREAFIQVDLDNNDPNIPDGREFDESNPRFTALDRREIDIRSEDSLRPTPTPTPTSEAGA